MRPIPSRLKDWLNSPASTELSTPFFTGQSLQGWTLKVFGHPACKPLRGDWPPEVIVANDSDQNPKEVWLILRCPNRQNCNPLSTSKPGDGTLSLSQKGREVLQKILNHQIGNELDLFRKPIPIWIIPGSSGSDPQSKVPQGWIAWPFSDSQQQSTESQSAPSDRYPGEAWELLACLLERLGIPPDLILKDWERQLQMWNLLSANSQLTSELHSLSHRLLVSKSGLLLPLCELHLECDSPKHHDSPQTISSFNAARSDGDAPKATRQPVRGLAKLATILALVAGSLTGIALSFLPKSNSIDQFSSIENRMDLAQQTGIPTSPSGDVKQAIAPKLVDSFPLDRDSLASEDPSMPMNSTSMAQLQEPTIVRTEIGVGSEPISSVDGTESSVEKIVRDSLAININVQIGPNQDPDRSDQQPPDNEPAEELPVPLAVDKNSVGIGPDKSQTVETRIGISQGIQKRSYRQDRGFSAKNAKGVFTLNLDPGLEDKLHITGALSQELVGESSGSWNISMDKLDAELVLAIQSKPGSKWQVVCLVQIPSQSAGPMVTLNPEDPGVVLGRLASYSSWLQQTSDQWKYTASGATRPGQPSPTQMARMYSAKQKETEQAIKRWRDIERLATLVFGSMHVEVDLKP